MNKLLSITLLLTLALAMSQASLPAQAQDVPQSAWACPEGFQGQTLRIFNWSTYIAEDTVPNFEALCDVRVEYFEYSSNDEMINIVRANSAQYDLVFPNSNAITRMIEEELVQAIDHSKIPNLENIAETFRDRPQDPGMQYSVPYQWGTVGIGIDTTVIDPAEMQTWEDFFSYAGRVAWLEDQRIMLGIALGQLGFDANSTTEEEIQAAVDWLLESDNDVYQIAQDNGQDLLAQGEVDAVVEYNGDIFQLIADCECEDFAYITPAGTNLWMDGMAIPYNAPNPDLAHTFIDYVLDPVVGASISNYITYGSPNTPALEFIDPTLRDNPGIYPDEAILATTFVLTDTGAAEVLFNDAWNRLSASLVD
jgi:spermidine/putrescine transport system substrate-binding protein